VRGVPGQGSGDDGRTPRRMGSRNLSLRAPVRALVLGCALGAALVVAAQAQAQQTTVARPQAIGEFKVTGYWITEERIFSAKKIKPMGLSDRFREDFLYSATGVAMEGTGRADDGRLVHWASGRGAWVDRAGDPTPSSNWASKPPFARPGGCTWWRVRNGEPATNLERPTFPQSDDTWNNPPSGVTIVYPQDFATNNADGVVVPVCDRPAVAAGAAYPGGHDWTWRGFPDSYGIGIGTPITEWKSLATDRSVLPKGSRVYIEALKDTPAGGCFVAEDTGGAIIGKHIDVFVPFGYRGLPTKAELILLPEGVPCPPPRTLAPGPLGEVELSYLVPATQRDLRAGARTRARGLGGRRYREDFLYSRNGVVARGLGIAGRTTLVARGGGWWVNRRGEKTDLQDDGTWSNGKPFWRDGGWRTRKGRPTFRRANGRWAYGRGVTFLRYRDRFRVAKAGEFRAWAATAATAATAPKGTLIALEGIDRAQCLEITRTPRRLGSMRLQIVLPPRTDPSALPQVAAATVVEATDTCPRPVAKKKRRR
jgi:3D (Asp-Asp-Asp) domain-containing protein